MKNKIRLAIATLVVALGALVATQGPTLVAEKAPKHQEMTAQMPIRWGDGGSGGN